MDRNFSFLNRKPDDTKPEFGIPLTTPGPIQLEKQSVDLGQSSPSRSGRNNSTTNLSHRPPPSFLSDGNRSSTQQGRGRSKHPFKSYRLIGEYEQPWKSDPRMYRTRINNYIIWGFIILGFGLSGFVCWQATTKVGQHEYCLVYEDDFKTLNEDIWTREVQIDGFGTGSFDWTTTDPKNAYVDGEGLHIVPTLTNETAGISNEKIFSGHTLNLTKEAGDGSCTSTAVRSCSIRSNDTLGTIIPPVRSARLITKGKKHIRYGRVEVVAKLPQGDWLWPAIWMMPEKDTYGIWPRSGEIDIMESRGNAVDYPFGGRDVYASTLHWGPSTLQDAYWRTGRENAIRRTDYSKEFHTFGIEWSEEYIYTYRDSRLLQVLYTGFNKKSTLWEYGEFAGVSENQTVLENPWASAENPNAPFDQAFFLVLNVAVGSQNGWFPDNQGGKPWVDGGESAPREFYKSVDKWLPTWGEGAAHGMTVKSVKMWQQGKC